MSTITKGEIYDKKSDATTPCIFCHIKKDMICNKTKMLRAVCQKGRSLSQIFGNKYELCKYLQEKFLVLFAGKGGLYPKY